MKPLTILHLAILLYCPALCFGQREDVIHNEPLMRIYLNANRFQIDPTAQAIVLFEQGSVRLSAESMEYHVERTIKLIGDEAISNIGVINIPYKDQAFVTKIEATTYNMEDGLITEKSIRRTDVINEKLNENVSVSKFNLPGLKKGSIVHYAYSIYRPATLLIPEWNFQGEYPVLYSDYTINIPANITYNSIERLNVPMNVAKRKRELDECQSCSYSQSYGSSSEIMHKWVRRNVPAFKSEPFMSSADNFRERVKINIVTILNNGFKTQVFNNWEEFTQKYFYGDQDFGGQVFAENAFLKEQMNELIRDQSTETGKAKAIFTFIRDHFIAEGTDAGGKPEMNIKEIYRKKAGSAEGINLLLCAMLRKANLDSEPVLLSTRNQERLNALYIDPRNINYVVSKVVADNNTYLLDASNKYYPFNTIPSECYNGYSRTISKSGGTQLILDPDSIKDKTAMIVKLVPTTDPSKLLLTMDKQYGVYSAIAMRERWDGDTALVRKEIIRDLSSGVPAENITSITVKNLKDPDQPLSLHYEMRIGLDTQSHTIYMDPFFDKIFDKNPLPPAKRIYTVEMDYLQDINYLFHFEIPKGYTLDDFPKSVVLQYGDNQLATMKSIMNYDDPSGIFSLNSRFTTQTTLFPAGDYESLRTFYERAIEEQNKKLILKKKNP